MVNLSDHIESPGQDPPPHCTGNSIFGISMLELSEELFPVSKSVYKDELLENIYKVPYHSNLIPGSFPSTTLIKWQVKLK
jgi:hypothetical protein